MKEQKKALICIPCLLTGGTEIQTLSTVQALVQGGHDVTVACYFEHAPEMVSRYRKAGAKVVLFSPNGVRPTGWRSIIFLYKHLRRIVKQLCPDVTHVQYMAPGATVILLLWLMGVKNIIATAHTAADIYKDLRLIHFIQRHCVRAFTCITEIAERSFFGTSQLYTPNTELKKRNHFTIHNCLTKNDQRPCLREHEQQKVTRSADVESHRVGYKKRVLSTEQRFTLGVVSRLETIKGMDLVVPVFAEVLKQHPGTRLIVVGDGSLRSAMEQQAIELGCNDNITWAGRQP
jgi:glycosyltransferase involved in cell wall biosynthesis